MDARPFPCTESGLKTLCIVTFGLNVNEPLVLSGWKKLFRKILFSPPNLILCDPTTFVSKELNAHCVSVSSVSVQQALVARPWYPSTDRKSTRLNSSHSQISYAVF